MLVIRPVCLDSDFEAIDRLNKQAFVECWSTEGLYSALLAGMDCFVLEDHGQIIAYVLSQDLLGWVEVMQLAVAAPYRRRGMAVALMQHLIHQKHHLEKIVLEVRDSNLAARRLYQQLGFQETGRRKGYYQPLAMMTKSEDAVIMERAGL